MNRDNILNDIIKFAKTISDLLNLKDLKQFKADITFYVYDSSLDNYRFLNKIIDICHRKNIEVPKVMGDFLLYEEDLQKDIIYSFVLNLKSKNKESN